MGHLILTKKDLGPLYINPDVIGSIRELPAGMDGNGREVEIRYVSGTLDYMTRAEWEQVKPQLVVGEDSDLQAALNEAIREGVKLAQKLREAQERIEELEFQAGKTWWYIDDQDVPRCRNCNSETVYCTCRVRTTSGKYPKVTTPSSTDTGFIDAMVTGELFDISAPSTKSTTEVQVIPKEVTEEAIRRADMVVPGEAGLYRTSEDKQGGLPIPADLVPAFNDLAKSGEAAAGAPVSIDPNARSWAVTRVKRSTFKSTTSNSRRPMWTLYSEKGTANVFDHADPLRDHKGMLEEAGYLAFFQAMKDGETAYWSQYPIAVSVTSSGKFWDVKGFGIRKSDEVPDEPTGNLNPGQLAVCQIAKDMLTWDDLVVFDCETTGMDDDDEVVEIAGILLDPQHPSPAFQMLIKPTNMTLLRRPGNKNRTAVDIHGIDEKMLADAPHMGHADVLNMLSEFMDKKAWAAFNIDFDERLLFQSLDAVGVNDGFPEGRKNFCIQAMMNRYLGHEYSSLDESCLALKIARSKKHRADADAEDALKVLKALAAKVPDYTPAQPDPF